MCRETDVPRGQPWHSELGRCLLRSEATTRDDNFPETGEAAFFLKALRLDRSIGGVEFCNGDSRGTWPRPPM